MRTRASTAKRQAKARRYNAPMWKPLLQPIGAALARFLMEEVPTATPLAPNDFVALGRTLQPGDVLLVEGNTRISGAIKYLTQSTWSHAAIYLGPMAGRAEPDGEAHVLIEAELVDGVRSAPLSKYRNANSRICRPLGLKTADTAALVDSAMQRLGEQYDLHNLFDLFRYMLPTPPIPAIWRRRSLAIGAADPTRAICSTLIAQVFKDIAYPILPIVERQEDLESSQRLHAHVVREIFHVRNTGLYVPRDFDLSAYFAVVKPTLENGFDFHTLTWTKEA